MAVSHINRSTITPRNNNYFISNNDRSISTIGCGAIISLGGVFLLFAAYQILPQGVNFVSRLGLVNKVAGGVSVIVGLSVIYLRVVNKPQVDPVNNLDQEVNKTQVDPVKKLPSQVVNKVFEYLTINDLSAVNKINNQWCDISSKKFALSKMRKEVAEILFERRQSWRTVITDLHTPFPWKSELLAPAFGKDQAITVAEEDYLKTLTKLDVNALRVELEKLKRINKLWQLNCFYTLGFGRETTLHTAAAAGKLEHVKVLVEYGAKDAIWSNKPAIVTERVRGQSALLLAAIHGHIDMVKYLLEQGACVAINFGDTGCLYLGSSPHDLLNIFIANTSKVAEIFKEHPDIFKEHMECFILLVRALKFQITKKYWPINLKTLLATSLNDGIWQIGDLILAFGVPKALSNANILSFVNWAISHKDLERVKWLHDRNVIDLINFRSSDTGSTLLHFCVLWNANEVLDYLISIGVPKDVRNRSGETYLESGLKILGGKVRRAILARLHTGKFKDPDSDFEEATIEECLKNRIDLNVPDEYGYTVLYYYARSFRMMSEPGKGIIDHLLEHGADPFFENHFLETPILRAENCIKYPGADKDALQIARKRLENMKARKK